MPLTEADARIQIQNELDYCLKNRRQVELAAMRRDVEQLRDTATDMNRAIEELEMKLVTLRAIAFDVRLPHTHTRARTSS